MTSVLSTSRDVKQSATEESTTLTPISMPGDNMSNLGAVATDLMKEFKELSANVM